MASNGAIENRHAPFLTQGCVNSVQNRAGFENTGRAFLHYLIQRSPRDSATVGLIPLDGADRGALTRREIRVEITLDVIAADRILEVLRAEKTSR